MIGEHQRQICRPILFSSFFFLSFFVHITQAWAHSWFFSRSILSFFSRSHPTFERYVRCIKLHLMLRIVWINYTGQENMPNISSVLFLFYYSLDVYKKKEADRRAKKDIQSSYITRPFFCRSAELTRS